MAFSQRYLIPSVFWIVALAGCCAPLMGQSTSPAATATFKTLLLSPRDHDAFPAPLYYDHRGRKIHLNTSTERLSSPHPVPPDGIVSVYREVKSPDTDGPPQKVPVTEFRIEKQGAWLVMFNVTRARGQFPEVRTRVLDHSLVAFPSGMVKIFNFCKAPILVKIGEGASGSQPFELPPGKDERVAYPTDIEQPYLWLNAAGNENGAWTVKISSPQTIIHQNTRAIWILTDTKGPDENSEPLIRVRNLVEPTPAPLN